MEDGQRLEVRTRKPAAVSCLVGRAPWWAGAHRPAATWSSAGNTPETKVPAHKRVRGIRRYYLCGAEMRTSLLWMALPYSPFTKVVERQATSLTNVYLHSSKRLAVHGFYQFPTPNPSSPTGLCL